jgi:hypothetical protein
VNVKSNIVTRVILIVSILDITLILGVASGVLDFMAESGRVSRIAIGSLVIYWLLICMGVLVVANARRRWRELILLLCSILATMIFAELGTRYLFPEKTMPDFHGVSSREYHHIYPKNEEMYMGTYEGKSVIVRTNEDGLRTKYSRVEFLQHKNRIAILGDSFTFGLGVRQEFTFPEVTEKMLKSRLKQDNIAVLNAGVISYSPLLEDLLFSGCVRNYKPTVVMLFLDAGDFGDDYAYTREIKREGNRAYFDTGDEEDEIRYYGALWKLGGSYIEAAARYAKYPYDLVSRGISKLYMIYTGHPSDSVSRPISKKEKSNYYKFELNIDGVVELNRFFIYRHPLESTKPYFLNTLANLNHVADNVRESGAQFILVIMPRFHHWNPKECPNNWEKSYYSLNEPYQYEYFKFFEQIKSRLNYRVFNLLPAFQETKEFPLVFDNDPHWNEKGHAFVARVVANYLIENHCIE